MDAFATFYEVLFTGKPPRQEQHCGTEQRLEPIGAVEIAKQLRHMKPGKAADGKGVVAEMLKAAGRGLHEVLADLFNEVLEGPSVQEEWRKTWLQVLFKKGDPQLLENYRPISILPILLKLFSRVLYSRIEVFLAKTQSVDQAGFKSNFSCDDHMFTVTMLHEKSREWNIPIWIAAIDFKKAFDTVEHFYLWEALGSADVPKQCIDTLRKLYRHEVGMVVADRESRAFEITRGTKQGDPISPQLFNVVLERVMSRLKPVWQKDMASSLVKAAVCKT